MVFYRKYRPQKIGELDSEKVRDLLSSVLSSKDIAHAFLFTGPKGLGKTSAARIVAKVVNCEVSRGVRVSRVPRGDPNSSPRDTRSTRSTRGTSFIEPCNQCYQCISITNGTNIDVLEIDGASNRGIDEIRELREKIRLAPAASRRKVYIIDEVHMLTQEAFNALLKTLEEPPLHVIFVLCTTEPHKVPATISSRCFHIPFKKATTKELVRSFERIAEKEKLVVEKDTLSFIASLSDGSFRDGAKVLEEMATFDKKITKELIEQKYQISNIKYQIEKMIELFSAREVRGGLKLVSELVNDGIDMKYFIEQLISELHEMLLVQIGINESQKTIPDSIGDKSQNLEMGETKELVELLSRAYGELKYAVLPQLPLELAIVEWCVQKAQNTLSIGKSAHQLNSRSVNSSTVVQSTDSPTHRSTGLLKHQSFPSVLTASDAVPKDNFWQELIDKVKVYNHSIAGVLRGCRLKSFDNKEIIIETGYKFHKERLEEKKTREILGKVCKEIAGKTIDVSVLLKE